MTQHRIVTEQEVLQELEHCCNDISRMNENMLDCKYDLDDCFVSYALQNTHKSVCNLQLEILRNGGVWTFTGYQDVQGNWLRPITFKNKFGSYTTCYKNEAKGITIYSSANTVKGLARKGIKKVRYTAPAWAKLRGGNVLGQAYAHVYEAEYNRCTGKEEPIKVLGEVLED